jgi:hypothetical protein
MRRVTDLAAWGKALDEERAGSGSSASQTAHNTASATAKRDIAARHLTTQGGAGAPAQRFHGQVMIGHTATGNNVQGVYNHNTKTITPKAGGQIPVMAISSPNQAPAPALPSGPSLANQYGRTLNMAAPKLGSGTRFRRLSATLAAKGASNPDALAAWIGRKKYGAAKMGGLSHSHSNVGLLDILLADTGYDNSEMKCPSCGYQADSAKFAISGGASGTSDSSSDLLRTPSGGDVASTGFNSSQGVTASGGGSVKGALSNTYGLAGDPLPARLAVTGPFDYIINRSADDPSVVNVRHRRGGDLIGQMRKTDDGWQGVVGTNALEPRHQQRAALLELLSVHNRSVVTNSRGSMPLQAPPQQTALMARYGIPAVRAFATPGNGSGDGPRTTTSDSGDGDGPAGLTPKGQAIYKKLIAKGFSTARALAFAKNSQNMSSGSFKKAS